MKVMYYINRTTCKWDSVTKYKQKMLCLWFKYEPDTCNFFAYILLRREYEMLPEKSYIIYPSPVSSQ
jgi:hypothetical protein